jgi:hypothetical protein
MKIGVDCGYCLLHRGYKMIMRATEDKEKRIEAMKQLLSFLGEEYNSEAVPSILGTGRERVIRKITGCSDPYLELKRLANEKALKLLPKMEDYIDRAPEEERLRVASKIACLGNVIEYDVPNHSSNFLEALESLNQEFYIDDLGDLLKIISPGKWILYLTDNAGEIAFDKLVVRELRKLGGYTIVAVKGGPSLNDALIEDAELVGMFEEADRIITTGIDGVGVNLEEASEEFKKYYYNVDLIIAKGMANWETLTEYMAPTHLLYLFRTKCRPVAEGVKAPINRCIAKLVPPGWRL